MEDYLKSIKTALDLTLENFIFNQYIEKSFIIQLEDYLDENLEPMLYYGDSLIDYWISIRENGYDYIINIGVQIGEHEDARIYNIETIFRY